MKREVRNKDIREALKASGMHQWELADALKVSDQTLFRWMRHEMSDEMKARIFQIIEEWKKDNCE